MCGAMYRALAAAAAISCRPCSAARSASASEVPISSLGSPCGMLWHSTRLLPHVRHDLGAGMAAFTIPYSMPCHMYTRD